MYTDSTVLHDICFSVSVANGIYQNTVFGMGAKLPFKYTGAVILGAVSICVMGTASYCLPEEDLQTASMLIGLTVNGALGQHNGFHCPRVLLYC